MVSKTDVVSRRKGKWYTSGSNFTRKTDRLFENITKKTSGTLLITLGAFAKLASREAYKKIYDKSGRHADGYWDYLSCVPTLLSRLLVHENAQSKYTRDFVNALGKDLATGAHTKLHNAFTQGRVRSKVPDNKITENSLKKAERLYRSHLRTLRQLTIDTDANSILVLQSALSCYIYNDLSILVEGSASTSRFYSSKSSVARVKNVGLRASRLARRYCMLLAACQLLHWRLTNKRTINSSKKIASEREKILRQTRFDRSSRQSFSKSQLNKTIQLFGEFSEIKFIERPRKPYTLVTLDNKQIIKVAYKSLQRQGAKQHCRFIVQGKVKKDSDGYFLEAEFEGSGQHASEYWEDWLADAVRGVYELYPGTIHMDWEFPLYNKKSSRADLLSRIM